MYTSRFAPRTDKVCLQCGTGFSVIPSKINKKYCSITCRGMARHKKIEKECIVCKSKYLSYPKSNSKYCSTKCQRFGVASQHSLRPKGTVFKKCLVCGTEFSRTIGAMTERAKYCSLKCKGIAMRIARTSKICEVCGTEFTFRITTSRRFCSKKCKGVIFSGENNPRYLDPSQHALHGHRGPSWKAQRRKAFNRDGGVCQECGSDKSDVGSRSIQVHHKIPFREFGIARHMEANDLSNLITLCVKCHVKAESRFFSIAPVYTR